MLRLKLTFHHISGLAFDVIFLCEIHSQKQIIDSIY